MWSRFWRAIRSFFGLFVRSIEDPKLILRQAMDDLQTQIPKMNERAAEIITHQKLLEGQAERTAHNIADLERKVEIAVKGGEPTRNAALVLIQQLEREQAHMTELNEGLAQAQVNSQKIMQMRAAFEQKVRKQIEECRAQLSRAEMAQAEEQMANLMGSFKVGDLSDTLDTVTGQIDERLAKARAKMQVAGESTDAQIAQVELQTSAASAEDKYASLAAKYGVATPQVEVARTMTGVLVGEQDAQDTVVSIPMANGNVYEPKSPSQPVNVTIKTGQ